jgi:hypothetical protein
MCIDYVLEITFPDNCSYSASIDLDASVPGVDLPNLVEILDVKTDSTNVTVKKIGGNALRLNVLMSKEKRYTVWMHCRLGDAVPVNSKLVWGARAHFVAKADGLVEGSLDPSFFYMLGDVKRAAVGDRVKWVVDVKNDGNSPSAAVSIEYKVPHEFDFDSVRIVQSYWKGDSMKPDTIIKTEETRSIVWRFVNGKDPLNENDSVKVVFEVLIQHSWECTDHGCGHRKKLVEARRIPHTVKIQLAGDKVIHPITNSDLPLACSKAERERPPRAERYNWVPVAAFFASTVTFTAMIIEKAFKGN